MYMLRHSACDIPNTHPIWANNNCPVSSGGETHPPTITANCTDTTVASSFKVDGGTNSLVQKTQDTFAGLSKTISDPDLDARFKTLSKTWGYSKL